VLATTLDLSTEALMGTESKTANRKGAPNKRGPAPRIQQQLERISALPRTQQRFVSQVLDSVLAQAGG